jgi:Holliday junction resolvase RusA-like endonuclease
MYVLVTVRGQVPSKANSYRIARRGGGGSRLIKDEAVALFEQRLALAARTVFRNLAVEPLFPAPQPVEVRLVWHRKRHDHRRRDLDNIHKAVADALTDAGAWDDDRQVTTWHSTVRFDADEGGEEWLDILLCPDLADPRPQPRSRSRKRT